MIRIYVLLLSISSFSVAAAQDSQCAEKNHTAIARVMSTAATGCEIELQVYGKEAISEEGCSRILALVQSDEWSEAEADLDDFMGRWNGKPLSDIGPECKDELELAAAHREMAQVIKQIKLTLKY